MNKYQGYRGMGVAKEKTDLGKTCALSVKCKPNIFPPFAFAISKISYNFCLFSLLHRACCRFTQLSFFLISVLHLSGT